MRETVKVATVVSVEKIEHSTLGNPNWLVTFEDGTSHRTSSNRSISYEITENNFTGEMVNVYLTPSKRIVDMRKCGPVTPGSG